MKLLALFGLLLLTSPAACELSFNPDGYVGGMTVDVSGEATPRQEWAYSTSRPFTTDNTNEPDFRLDSNIRNIISGWSTGADLKYPVTDSFTLSVGGSYIYQQLTTQESYAKTVLYPGQQAHLEGSTNYDTSHGIYSMRASVRYYFKPF